MKSYISGSACEVFIRHESKKILKRVYYTNEGVENGHHKLTHEIQYLRQMNQECELFPRVLSDYYKNDYLYMELEYLFEGESLADLIFDDTVDTEYVERSIECIISRLFKEFYIKRFSEINPAYWYDCYIARTIRRLNVSLQLIQEKNLNWSELRGCILHGITINGISYPSAYQYMEYLSSHMEALKNIRPHASYRTHHDLIPENILIQRGSHCVADFKMIDPRGESETGIGNRHFIYDMGKMLFGLDCYGLFRRAYHEEQFKAFRFVRNASFCYELMYNKRDKTVQKLINAQKTFVNTYYSCCQKTEEGNENSLLQLMFSAACMYIPDIPCRMIDENMEELCIAFYARGCMFLHELMLLLYGCDELSSDIDGTMYSRWPADEI